MAVISEVFQFYSSVVLFNNMVVQFRITCCYTGLNAVRYVYKDHKLCIHAVHKLHVAFRS